MKEKTFALSTKNLDVVMGNIRKQIKDSNNGVPIMDGFMMKEWTRTGEIDRNKYRGKGRPRKNDYVFVKTLDLLRDAGGNVLITAAPKE